MRALPLALLAALALVPAASPAGTPILGVDSNGPASRLAWFDSQTLRMLPGRKAPLAWHIGSWSLSADRSTLAIGGEGATLRLVDARRMRVLGDVRLAPGGDSTAGVSWLRPGRLLAFVRLPGDTTAVVVDPSRRRVLRRLALGGQLDEVARLPDRVAVLLRPEDGLGPARVAVVGADGGVRYATIDRIQVGSPLQVESGEIVRTAEAGLAVDPGSRTAWIVGGSALAEVDLDTLAVTYRSSPRQLAKALDGPFRTARWLGGGLLAVAGGDYSTAKGAGAGLETTVDPYGLRILDLAAGTSRTIDPQATSFQLANGLLLVRHGDSELVAYGRDGAARFRVDLTRQTWLNPAGGTGLVCANRTLVGVVDLGSGVRRDAQGSSCADLLAGRSSDD